MNAEQAKTVNNYQESITQNTGMLDKERLYIIIVSR